MVSAAPSSVLPIGKGQLTTSDTCGSCHRDIYRMWKASAHSRSLEDTIFLDGFHETDAREGPAVARLCLKCHAPMIDVNGDIALRRKITWEGVSCDICHSIVSVDFSGQTPRLVLDVGPVKRGPIREAASMAHEVAFSELHTTPLACAGCHEYVNPEGISIISTYSEWKASAAPREGKSCQSCHMGRTAANVVEPRVKRVTNAEVNLHEVPGGHSLDQLHKALGVSVQPKREGEYLLVDVTLTNRGAGHAVPTGMPGRRVILDVRVGTSDGGSFEQRRIYTKQLQAAGGSTIQEDSRYFSPGVRLVSDTRIRPAERRLESFRFPVPARASAFIGVTLSYEHAPRGGTEDRTWITFQSENRTVLPEAAGR